MSRPLISIELDTGTSIVNTHNVSGIVVPPENPQALKEAILKLLNDYYIKLEIGSLNHYNHHFTAEHMSQTYFDIYKRIIHGRSSKQD